MRTTRRTFPDVAQLGLAAATTLNQSRITFTGQPGLVIVFARVTVLNAGAGAHNAARLQWLNTAQPLAAPLEYRFIPGGVGEQSSFFTYWIGLDPAENSFIELQITPDVSTLDVSAANGNITVVSFPKEATQGPVASVQ